MSQSIHIPVMLEKSLELLNVRPGLSWLDATAGGGGHLRELARRAGSLSTIVGIDRDPAAIAALKQQFGDQIHLVQANYSDIEMVVSSLPIGQITGGIIADLGVSSLQLGHPQRGFSFLVDGPLDMRMDPHLSVTAADLVNNLPEKELANILFNYGEERHSRRLARAIVKSRPMRTTIELANLVASCLPASGRDRSHPATRTFQALRIAVNNELESLAIFLRGAVKVMAAGARLVIISFHSLEDRLVKQNFRELAKGCICPPRQPLCTCHKQPELLIITRKPILPDKQEVLANPRARSAKLRAGEKVA